MAGRTPAYMAVRDALKRSLPGRIVGLSIDSRGQPAYRLALQTREQHIRREKATSNICTAQVLLAVIASMYAVYHGPEGLTHIARTRAPPHRGAGGGTAQARLCAAIEAFFDTVTVEVGDKQSEIVARALAEKINLRIGDGTLGIALDETTTPSDRRGGVARVRRRADLRGDRGRRRARRCQPTLKRDSAFLTHPVFHAHRSETELLRYMRKLSDRDLALDRAMIPLGSCTMKLNATTEMIPLTWPEFGSLHPFAPPSRRDGYHALFERLEQWLCDITGYDAVSLQPNSGAQGEYAGLLAIRGYHAARGEPHRKICLIPSSAHGTNPASAQMAGMEVVVVACDARGDVDVDDLRAKAEKHSAKPRRGHDHLSLDPRRVRGAHPRDLRHRPRPWRPGLSRRRQPERAGRPRPARRLRRRRQPSQSAQDLLHPAWRRRPRHGPDRRQGASGAVPARPSVPRDGEASHGGRPGVGGAVSARPRS